jgi:hypothetical protein
MGTLEVTPLRAHNIQGVNKPLSVRVSYGQEVYATSSKPPAADLVWHHETKADLSSAATASASAPGTSAAAGAGRADSNAASSTQTRKSDRNDDSHPPQTIDGSEKVAAGDDESPQARRRPSLVSKAAALAAASALGGNDAFKASFEVDTANIRGDLSVKVMMDGFPSKKEVARIDIPIFNILDCTCLLDGEDGNGHFTYVRWFPLLSADECIPAEGEMFNPDQYLKPEQEVTFGHNRPCILLRLRWICKPDSTVPDSSHLFARLQLPSLSVVRINTVTAFRGRLIFMLN